MKLWLALLLCALPSLAQTKSLQSIVDETAAAAFAKFPKLQKDHLAITAIDPAAAGDSARASYRGDVPIYPASVIKLFYLEAAHRWIEDGKLNDTPELRRAMKDMIVQSYNEATHYVLDALTETTSGPALPAAEMEAWSHKRNAVNRYFAARGFEKINANQKPWCEGPYGRERIFVGEKYTNRNALTTDATARLLLEIATERAVTPGRSRQMLELLSRDPDPTKDSEGGQVKGFTGAGLPPTAKLWSKAGWTSATRHDAALFQLPNGRRLILVTFTVNNASDSAVIPFIAKSVADAL